MASNEKRVQKHVVLNSPGEGSEVETERQGRGPRESGVSRGTIIKAEQTVKAVRGVKSVENQIVVLG